MRTVLPRFAGVLVCIIGLTGQPPQSNIRPASIEGIVVEAATGRPVADARVSTDRSPPRGWTATDRNGRFQLSGVLPGPRRIFVRKPPFAPTRIPGRRLPGHPAEGVWIDVPPGESIKEVVIPLLPGGVISGRAQADDQVGLARYTYGPDGDHILRVVETVRAANGADNAGEYRFEGIESGEYYVFLNFNSFGFSVGGGKAFPITYYPGTPYIREAARITVTPGKAVRLEDFRLEAVTGPRVRLRFINMTGDTAAAKPCGSMTWKLRGAPISDGSFVTGTCPGPSASNIFTLANMPPGLYDLYAAWQGLFNAAAPGEGASVSFEVRGVDLEIEVGISSARLTGRLVTETVDGTLQPASGLNMTWNPRRIGPAVGASTSADGSFQIHRVSAGEYTAEISPLPPDAYISELHEGDRDVLVDGLEVRSTDLRIDGVISLRGATLQGLVTDSNGDPAQGAIVALVPELPRRKNHYLYRTALTNKTGEFLIRGIAPGAYSLFAWSELDGAAYKNADFMSRYETRGLRIVFDKGERLAVRTTLIE